MKRSSWLLAVVASGFVASLATPHKAAADLDEQYLRNGECYMLIGETGKYRGIYRLNNAVKGIYNLNKLVIPSSDLHSTNNFNVDLNRTIFTFTEEVPDPTPRVRAGNIYRQVMDGITDRVADGGTSQTLHHHDSRSSSQKNRDIYRVVNSGASSRAVLKYSNGYNCARYCPNNKNGKSCTYKILNPGSPVTPPAGYKLPVINTRDNRLKLDIYPGANWYSIPNGTWYESRKMSSGGYLNYVDTEYEIVHHWFRWDWRNNAGGDNVSYSIANRVKKGEVAYSYEKYTTRESVNGCLDSCAAATDSGRADAPGVSVDIAMQPPMLGGGGDRVYALARADDGSDSELSIAENGATKRTYTAKNKGYIRGTPDDYRSKWIGISLKDANQDYVYIMGSDTIKLWYNLCWPGVSTANMDIRAVGVSNQWHQKGGIVYAYDKSYNAIYKFECEDTGGRPTQLDPGVSNLRFDTIYVKKAIDSMGGDGNHCEVDDIKADGFGSVYFAVTFPSTNRSTYKAEQHFKPTDAVHMCERSHDENGNVSINVILMQEFGKVVFEKKISDDTPRKVGGRTFAIDYYSFQTQVSPDCYNELKALSWPNSSWVSVINKYHPSITTSNWRNNIKKNNGYCAHKNSYKNLNDSDPGHCKIAVINVPTPPRIYSLSGYNSYLDIIGPFTKYPKPNGQSTAQSSSLLVNKLDRSKVYYYMVENYPIPEYHNAQDPNNGPDWDGDGRRGGFITSVMDRESYSSDHPNGIRYEWKTWMVMDLYGNCVCELADEPKYDQSGRPLDGSNCYTIYSPVFGKFIITCRVQYDWYNYDKVPFGGNIVDMENGKYPGVKNFNKWAYPVNKNSLTHQKASERLAEIKNSFTYDGKKFMIDPFYYDEYKGVYKTYSSIEFSTDEDDREKYKEKPDYSKIIADGDYLALEPVTIGEKGPNPDPVYQTAAIERCDDIPGWDASNYITNASYWKGIDKSFGYFGVKAGEVYNWRINVASQTNMIDLTFLRNEMKNNPKSPFYVNGDPEFQFRDNAGELKWASDDSVLVSASLEYEVPRDGGGTEKKTIALRFDKKNGSGDATTGSSGKFEKKFTLPNPGNVNDVKNLVYYTTAGDLPPTDPKKAKLRITMRRQYKYKMWSYENGMPKRLTPFISNWFEITGEAEVLIIDSQPSTVAWDKTSHNNLFGITGQPLTVGEGPNKQFLNPAFINFTINDNSPWEDLKITPAGLNLSTHVQNYAYNYGGTKCNDYCSGNSALAQYNPGSGYDVDGQISNAKKNHKPSANFNFKPLFCKAARDVRISFETTRRTNDSSDASVNGRVTVGRGDKLYLNGKKDMSGRNFNENTSTYSFHYHNKPDGSQLHKVYLEFVDSTFKEVRGKTEEFKSTNTYKFNVPNLPIGTKDNGKGSSPRYTTNNIVPDGYANNTPNYRPYRFFISYTDSSGNYVRDELFNVALNVIDNIPPIGYGYLVNYKDHSSCYFPSKVLGSDKNINKPENAPSYYLDGENYFGDYNNALLRADWNTVSNKARADGYINGVTTGSTRYRALKFLSDNITEKFNDSVLLQQIKNGVGPNYMEDNVECDFRVYVSDNCGDATAKLTVKYLDAQGNPQDGIIFSNWKSASSVDGKTTTIVDENDKVFHTIFRGKSEQFPMGIPIMIEAEDNALTWDYWIGTGASGEWKWTNKVPSKASHNKRVFKTTLPVYDSSLDIRVLDKTIKTNGKR